MIDKSKLIDSLKSATNNFTTGFTSSTCMGWTQEYDEEGRPLLYDPNYKDGSVKISGAKYYFTRVGWYVYIWKEERKYTTVWNDRCNDYLLEKLDLSPDYVKEFRNSKIPKKVKFDL